MIIDGVDYLLDKLFVKGLIRVDLKNVYELSILIVLVISKDKGGICLSIIIIKVWLICLAVSINKCFGRLKIVVKNTEIVFLYKAAWLINL